MEQRLIPPEIPFRQIRRLRHIKGQYGILSKIINASIEVNTIVNKSPRNLEEDHCFCVHIKKNLFTKASMLMGSLINESSNNGKLIFKKFRSRFMKILL